jgi:hypothetical protein
MLNQSSADRAYQRVDALLRAYGISHSAVRSQHCLDILEEAIQATPQDKESLESLAAQIALNRLRQGVDKLLAGVVPGIDSANHNDFYLALQADLMPQKHPDFILGDEVPDDVRCQSIRARYDSQSTPTLRRISMGASALRFDSIDGVAGSTEQFFQRYPFLRTYLKLILTGLMLSIIYTFAK